MSSASSYGRRPFPCDASVTPVTYEFCKEWIGQPTAVYYYYFSCGKIAFGTHGFCELGTWKNDPEALKQQGIMRWWDLYQRITDPRYLLIPAFSRKGEQDVHDGYYVIILDPVENRNAREEEDRKQREAAAAAMARQGRISRAQPAPKAPTPQSMQEARSHMDCGQLLEEMMKVGWRNLPELHRYGDKRGKEELSHADVEEWKLLDEIHTRAGMLEAITLYTGVDYMKEHKQMARGKFSNEASMIHPTKLFSLENAVKARFRDGTPQKKIQDPITKQWSTVSLTQAQAVAQLRFRLAPDWPPYPAQTYRRPRENAFPHDFKYLDFPHLEHRADSTSAGFQRFLAEQTNNRTVPPGVNLEKFYAQHTSSHGKRNKTFRDYVDDRIEYLNRMAGNSDALKAARNDIIEHFNVIWNTDTDHKGSFNGLIAFEGKRLRTHRNFSFPMKVCNKELNTAANLVDYLAEVHQTIHQAATAHVVMILLFIVVLDATRKDGKMRLLVVQFGMHGSGKSYATEYISNTFIKGTIMETAHASDHAKTAEDCEGYMESVDDGAPALFGIQTNKDPSSWDIYEARINGRGTAVVSAGTSVLKANSGGKSKLNTKRFTFDRTRDGKTVGRTVETDVHRSGNMVVNINRQKEELSMEMVDRIISVTPPVISKTSDGKTRDIISVQLTGDNKHTQTKLNSRFTDKIQNIQYLVSLANILMSIGDKHSGVLDSPTMITAEMLNNLVSINMDRRGGALNVRGSRKWNQGVLLPRSLVMASGASIAFGYTIGGPDPSRLFQRSDIKKMVPFLYCTLDLAVFSAELGDRYSDPCEEDLCRVLKDEVFGDWFKEREKFLKNPATYKGPENPPIVLEKGYLIYRGYFNSKDSQTDNIVRKLESLSYHIKPHLKIKPEKITKLVALLTELMNDRIRLEGTGGLSSAHTRAMKPLIISQSEDDKDLKIHLNFLLTYTTKDGVVCDVLTDMMKKAKIPKFKAMRSRTEPGRYDKFIVSEFGVDGNGVVDVDAGKANNDDDASSASSHVSASKASSSSNQPSASAWASFSSSAAPAAAGAVPQRPSPPPPPLRPAQHPLPPGENTLPWVPPPQPLPPAQQAHIDAARKHIQSKISSEVKTIKTAETALRAAQYEDTVIEMPNPSYKDPKELEKMIIAGTCTREEADTFDTKNPQLTLNDRTDEHVAFIHLTQCGISEPWRHVAMSGNLKTCINALYEAQTECTKWAKLIYDLLSTREYMTSKQQSEFVEQGQSALNKSAEFFSTIRFFTNGMPMREWSTGRITHWFTTRELHTYDGDHINPKRINGPRGKDELEPLFFEYCDFAVRSIRQCGVNVETVLRQKMHTFTKQVVVYLRRVAVRKEEDSLEKWTTPAQAGLNKVVDIFALRTKFQKQVDQTLGRIKTFQKHQPRAIAVSNKRPLRPMYTPDGQPMTEEDIKAQQEKDQNQFKAGIQASCEGFYDEDDADLPVGVDMNRDGDGKDSGHPPQPPPPPPPPAAPGVGISTVPLFRPFRAIGLVAQAPAPAPVPVSVPSFSSSPMKDDGDDNALAQQPSDEYIKEMLADMEDHPVNADADADADTDASRDTSNDDGLDISDMGRVSSSSNTDPVEDKEEEKTEKKKKKKRRSKKKKGSQFVDGEAELSGDSDSGDDDSEDKETEEDRKFIASEEDSVDHPIPAYHALSDSEGSEKETEDLAKEFKERAKQSGADAEDEPVVYAESEDELDKAKKAAKKARKERKKRKSDSSEDGEGQTKKKRRIIKESSAEMSGDGADAGAGAGASAVSMTDQPPVLPLTATTTDPVPTPPPPPLSS